MKIKCKGSVEGHPCRCTYNTMGKVKDPEPIFVNLLRSPGIDSQADGPVRQHSLTYQPARLHRPAESIPWNRFLGSLNIYKYGLRCSIIRGQRQGGHIPEHVHCLCLVCAVVKVHHEGSTVSHVQYEGFS